jgi:NADH-quinone oxidoreductase subunit G
MPMGSELQANTADLCPVGALTHKPQSFNTRPWELTKTPSIDVMDAVGSNIRVDSKGREVMRVLPRVNEAINEEWISDKTRQHVDGLRLQRLDRPLVRDGGRLRPASWNEAFSLVATRVKSADPKRVGAIAGDLAAVEEMFALKLLLESLGSSNMDCRQDGARLDPALGRSSYLFNPTIAGIEEADAILIVGANPRLEAAMVNARIRKRWRIGPVPVALIGERVDLTYDHAYLGGGEETLAELAAGRLEFAKALSVAKKPIVIVGAAALREAGTRVLASVGRILASSEREAGWNGLAVLHSAASRVGGLDIGFVPGEGGLDAAAMAATTGLDVLFNLGADEIEIAPGPFVIYQGTHGDRGAHRADVVLPGAAYTEKSGTFVNLEGRVQMTNRAVFPPGDAREDWAILRALSDVLGAKLAFDSLTACASSSTAPIRTLPTSAKSGPAEPSAMPQATPAAPVRFGSSIQDFYLTNPIARASRVMAECSALARGPVLQAAE